jgi:uncharacterized protein DUF4038/uncharacterized protein DUF5060
MNSRNPSGVAGGRTLPSSMPQSLCSFRYHLKLFLGLLFAATISQAVQARDFSFTTEANVMVEVTFAAQIQYADPFNDVILDAVFTDPSGKKLRVPAFWAGGSTWKVRYSSPVLGKHSFRTESSVPADKGLHGVTGKVQVKPYTKNNPALIHGPLRVSASHRYLEGSDGTPFFWMGDTWWMGLCHRLHWPDEVKTLAEDRKKKGFNVIQVVTGLYPDMYPFDPRGANEAGFPWTTNYSTIRPEYFNKADERLGYLVDEGFTVCIFGAWGHYLTSMGVDKMRQHWRYLIARYGAWPVVWSAAGEANLPWYGAKNFPYDDRKQAKAWMEVMRSIRATDPYHRPLSVHPTGINRESSRNVTSDPTLLDIDFLQTPHGKRDAVPATVKFMRESYFDHPVMPVIDAEASYEMLSVPGGPIPAEWTRRMFWLCMMNGAAGHTYGANGIWQCNRKNQPHGPSPTAGSPPEGYGAIAWDEAMNLPGSTQEGLGRKFLERFPWQKFTPHPEWADFAVKSGLRFNGCHWIWFPEGDPRKDAPAAKRFYRRAFVVPQGKKIESARLRISADNKFIANLNGQELGSGENWKLGREFDDLASRLAPGTNVIAIIGENEPTEKTNPPTPNPAGLIARLEIKFADATILKIDTDGRWMSSTNEADGWASIGFDDSSWTKAMVVGNYGDGPWLKLDDAENEGVFGPQCAGIPGDIHMIYAPVSEDIIIHKLGRHSAYAVSTFDPVTGKVTELPPMQADGKGSWNCSPPPGCDHDWVVVLKAKHPWDEAVAR